MAITRFIIPLTCALFLPLAASAQPATPTTPAEACCGAMHQMPPAATGIAPVDHSAHQAPQTGTSTMPGMPAETAADKPMANMACCAGMDAKDGTEAKACGHCAAMASGKAADMPARTPAEGCCAQKPKP